MHPAGRIDEVVLPVDFSYGTCLEERMRFILRAIRIVNDRQVMERAVFYRDHILLEFHLQAVFVDRGLLISRAVSRKQIDPLIIIDENTRIELADLIRTRTQDIPVLIAHEIQKLIRADRIIRDRDTDQTVVNGVDEFIEKLTRQISERK